MVVVALLGVGAFFTVYEGRPEPTPTGPDAAHLTAHWIDVVHRRAEQGYWIVVRGTHIGDQAVAAGSAGVFTHAAVYDARADEVVEAVGSGVHAEPVEDLLAQSYRFQIIRPRDYDETEGVAAVARARSRIGYSYDWLGTLGLQSDRRFYCTELAVDAYRARERGWMPSGVIHPEHMVRYGALVFDSGPRESSSPVGAASDEVRERFAVQIEDARGVDYAALVAPGLYRGGAPDAQGIDWLREREIRTVVDLRPTRGDAEGRAVRAAGMGYVHIPVASIDAPTPVDVQRFLAVVTDREAQPVYVHCMHGVDRTGAMIAAYRIAQQGWTNDDALAEMDHFGARGLLEGLRRFVGGFRPGSR